MELKQTWNSMTGCWEPQTNQDFIQSMNRKELAEFLQSNFVMDTEKNSFMSGLEWNIRRRNK